jgi:uncharacterized protein (TIGR03084 family)
VTYEAVLDALGQQHDELAGLLAERTPDEWARPTRCEGWDVADVVLHLAQTDGYAIASVRGELGTRAVFEGAGDVDAGAAELVARERGASGADVGARWAATAAELRAILRASDAHRRVRWVTGMLSTYSLASTRLAECWIHTGDVADAFGVALAPSERLRHIARLAWRTLPYAFRREGRELHGPVAFELRSPAGERWDFVPEEPPATVIHGDAFELCQVAARRVDPHETNLQGRGLDADAVLTVVRTYA